VALPTCELIYIALAEAFKEGICLLRLSLELGQKLDPAFLIYCHDRSAVALIPKHSHDRRTKHINGRYEVTENKYVESVTSLSGWKIRRVVLAGTELAVTAIGL
jgi:hypothetical protein